MQQYFSFRVYKAKTADRTLFFFPAGFTKLSVYRYTIHQLNKSGINVVGFDFKWRKAVRELDLEGLRAMMNSVDEVVTEYMAAVDDAKHTYAVFGSSFGGVIALYLAKRHKTITAVILNVPHATVSKVLWSHKPSRPFKRTLIRQGIDTEKKLHEALGQIEAQHELERLRGKKIVTLTAMNNTIVTNGLELAEALKAVNPHTVLWRTRFGHFVGGTLGVARKSKWDMVLK